MKIVFKKYVVLGLLLLPCGKATAQTKKWTIQECVEYALKNNISIQQSELDLGPSYRDWETDRKSTRLNSSH